MLFIKTYEEFLFEDVWSDKTQKFLENPNNHNKLSSGKYIYVPLVVDAKDILLYLHTMDGFFDSWSQNNAR